MRNYVVAGLAAGLMMTGVLIAAAPPASAGCIPGTQTCDGPIQPDGTWQRCISIISADTGLPVETCWLLGPGHAQPWNMFMSLPPNHIDP